MKREKNFLKGTQTLHHPAVLLPLTTCPEPDRQQRERPGGGHRQAEGSPPCGPCRSPRHAASPCSAPAPSPAALHGRPSPSGSPPRHDRPGQTEHQPPAGCSGRWAKTGSRLGQPSGEGRKGQVLAPWCFQDIPGEASSWGPSSSVCSHCGGAHTLRHMVISMAVSGQLAPCQHRFEQDGNRGLCWKLPPLHS